MRKVAYWPYFLLLAFLLLVLSLPPKMTASLRYYAVAGIAPFWEKSIMGRTFFLTSPVGFSQDIQNKTPEQLQLALENRLLHAQIESVYEWLSFEERIQEDIKKLREVSKDKHDDLYWNEFFRRRSDEMKQILEIQLQSIPAKVIFRDPTTWSSSIWINVGEDTNEALGRFIVAVNSPVVLGDSLVGLVEYVGKKQSRVRLITDAGLVPAVRAVRGEAQDRCIMKLAHALLERIYSRDDIFPSEKQKQKILQNLTQTIDLLSAKKKDFYLAKGELFGLSLPLWRGKGNILKGIGFNYDYPDKEGPARDLRTGKILSQDNLVARPLLKEGDLLVTTGLDGIFPSNLKVATVDKVFPLKEGDYAYDIEAKPTAIGLDELDMVFIMPPLKTDNDERI